MNLIDAGDWADFASLIQVTAFDTFGQNTIIWRRNVIPSINRYNEDNAEGTTVDVTLRCIVNYNYMRSWPITNMTESGELMEQSVQVLFSKADLQAAGVLNAAGMFEYQPDYDRFILDGTIRKPVGDSSVSQATATALTGPGGALLFEVIMVEQKTNTGDRRD